MGDVEAIRARLEAIAEELDELAYASLRESLEAGEGTAADERRLTRARRAVEKAVAALRPPGDVEH